MTTFNKAGDPDQSKEGNPQGPTFGADTSHDSGKGEGESGEVTQAQLAAILKRLNDKDTFIDQLKQENETLRTSQAKAPSIEEIMERLNQNQPPKQSQQEPVNVDEILQKATEAATNALTAKQQADQRKANFSKVQEVLTTKFGSEVDSKVKELAAQNDMSFEEAFAMAETKPAAFMKLFGLNETQAPAVPTPTRPGFNTFGQGNTPPPPPKRPDITQARTDRDRIAIAKQAFEDRGLSFEYL